MDKYSLYNKYRLDLPYPPVKVDCKNPEYARAMLDNVGGCISEMSAVSLYFYNSLVNAGQEVIAATFHKISIQEMHHLDIFGELALKLGTDPRLWSQGEEGYTYWTPDYNVYPVEIRNLLLNAISSEREAIGKYQLQMQAIDDENIVNILKRIILDEKSHLNMFYELYEEYVEYI